MRLPRRPAATLWDHNARFHPWLLRRLPDRLDRALDVGCGAGTFALRLAERAVRVDAIDASAAMVDLARSRAGADQVTWICGDVLDAGLEPASYDVVTAIASLHHLPLEAGLARLASLVRPGGRLLVVGLAAPTSWRDRLVDAVSLALDPVVGAALTVLDRNTDAGRPPPLRDPVESVDEVVAATRRLLPGARVRRRLCYRWTLVWVAYPGRPDGG